MIRATKNNKSGQGKTLLTWMEYKSEAGRELPWWGVWWIRTRLPMQGAQGSIPGPGDPTCRRATTEPVPRACAQKQEATAMAWTYR